MPRRFVLAMESGFLYYFKSPQEMSTPGVNPKVVAIVAHHYLSAGYVSICLPFSHACMRRAVTVASAPADPWDGAAASLLEACLEELLPVQARILAWVSTHPALRRLTVDHLRSEGSLRALVAAMDRNPALAVGFSSGSAVFPKGLWPEPEPL